MIPAGFHVPAVLRCRLDPCRAFGYGSLTLCGSPSHGILLTLHVIFIGGPTTPDYVRFGLLRFRSPLLTVDFSFSSCRYLDVSVPAYCPVMTVVMRSPLRKRRGFPIRISAGHRVLTARRRISLFAASFIASLCPGILRTPFLP